MLDEVVSLWCEIVANGRLTWAIYPSNVNVTVRPARARVADAANTNVVTWHAEEKLTLTLAICVFKIECRFYVILLRL